MKTTDPNIILSKLRTGDESPIMELYKLHRNEFIVWAKANYKASPEQAKDAFQEAVLDFHQNVITGVLVEFTSSIKTYLFQIGKYKLLNIIKKEHRITYHDNLQLIEGKEMEDYMDDENKAHSQEQLTNAINKLPEDCQKVLKLYYFNEFDMDSIARELKYKNSDTAKSKKSVCMKNLMLELKKITSILVF